MVDPKRLSSLFAVDRLVFLDSVPAARFLLSFGVDKAVRNSHGLYLQPKQNRQATCTISVR